MKLVKSNNKEQIVYAEVYAPNVIDTQGDYASADTIKKAAYKFLQEGKTRNIDIMHNYKRINAYVVESFIAKKTDKDFIIDSWVVGVHIVDKKIWDKIERGDFNGFSLAGRASSKKSELAVNYADALRGLTSEKSGHSHKFIVFFDESGNFLGGHTDTDEADGHSHEIIGHSVTEKVNDHNHTFIYVG